MDTVGIDITKDYVDFHAQGLFDFYVTTEGILTAVFAVLIYTVYKRVKQDLQKKKIQKLSLQADEDFNSKFNLSLDDWDK